MTLRGATSFHRALRRTLHALRRLSTAALLAASVATVACTPAQDVQPADSDAHLVSQRDSAGVRLVKAGFGRAPMDNAEQLRVLDTLLNASTPRGEALVGLSALQPLGDSSLVVFTTSVPALLRYAPGRERPDTFSHSGTAPGEYGARTAVLPYQLDTLLLWDWDAGRLTRITADGIGDTPVLLQYQLSRLASVSGAFLDGSVIGVAFSTPEEQDVGRSRTPAALVRFFPSGELRDTLVQFRGPERVVQKGRLPGRPDEQALRTLSVPFGRGTLWSIGTASVLLLDTEACHIERHDSTGTLVMRLDFTCAVEAVGEADRAAFLAEVLSSARSPSDSAVRQRFVDEATFPPSKSTASGLLTDAWDRIWLRLPPDTHPTLWIWWVFDADGTPRARFSLEKSYRIAAVRGRDALAVSADEDDALPVVVRLALPSALHRPD